MRDNVGTGVVISGRDISQVIHTITPNGTKPTLPTNVVFHSPKYEFDQLCETDFLLGVISEVQRLMLGDFESFCFYIHSGSDGNELAFPVAPEKTVVIIISDEFSGVPLSLCERVRLVFKSYLPKEGLKKNLHSLPLGHVSATKKPTTHRKMCDRTWNIFFSGNMNKRRLPLMRALGTPYWSPINFPAWIVKKVHSDLKFDDFYPHSYLRFTDGFRKGLYPETYADLLNGSRMVLCPHGFHSPETFRHFEAMRAGAIVVTEPLPPLYFYQGAPFITVQDWQDVRRIARKLLPDSDRVQVQQEATLNWFHERCSEYATAQRIVKELARST